MKVNIDESPKIITRMLDKIVESPSYDERKNIKNHLIDYLSDLFDTIAEDIH